MNFDLEVLRSFGWVELILKLTPLFKVPTSPEPNPELEACQWFHDQGWTPSEVHQFWDYNLSHKRGSKLEFYSLAQAKVAADSDDPRALIAQWHKCHASPCRKCPPPTPPVPLQGQRQLEALDRLFGEL